jgi:hypothetical protein
MKRLSSPTGEMIIPTGAVAEFPINQASTPLLPTLPAPINIITRHAILAHSGPNGSKISFYTGDYNPETDPAEGDISFNDARIKNIVKNHNEKLASLAVTYGGIEKMPIGAFPPILDLHEGAESINRVIGRLNCFVSYEVRDVPGVGQNCSCLMGDPTFLGTDTVDRVNDGRIFALSIGIDEETDTLGELSAVITPAAPGAMLLKKGSKALKGDHKMDVKKLEAHKKKMAKLTEMKSALTGMTKKVTAANEMMKLTKKQGEVTHRLTSLVKGGKITPAEFKKLDIKKLSALPADAIDTMINAFEAMEPKIMAGQKGSTAAMDFSSIGKAMGDKKMKNLKSEIKGDFKKLGKKLKSDEGDDEEEKDDKKEMSFDKADKEGEKKDMAAEEKAEDKSMSAELGAGIKTEDYQNASSEMQKQIDELNTNLARMAGMVDELMSSEQEEGKDLEDGAMDENTKEMSEDDMGDMSKKDMAAEEKPADGEKKDLGAEEKPDDKKDMAASDDKKDDSKKDMSEEKPEDKKDLSEDDDKKEEEKKKLTAETKKALTKVKKKKG